MYVQVEQSATRRRRGQGDLYTLAGGVADATGPTQVRSSVYFYIFQNEKLYR